MSRHFSKKKKDIKNSPQIGRKCSSWLIMRELQDVIFDLLETGKNLKYNRTFCWWDYGEKDTLIHYW